MWQDFIREVDTTSGFKQERSVTLLSWTFERQDRVKREVRVSFSPGKKKQGYITLLTMVSLSTALPYLYHIVFADNFTSYELRDANLQVIDKCALLS